MGKRRAKKKHGAALRDWAAKKSLLRALYGVLGDKPLVESVAAGIYSDLPKRRDFIDMCYDTLRRWRDGSSPIGERSLQFWETIIKDFKLSVGVGRLWSSTIVDFVELFRDQPNITTAVDELLHDSRVALSSDIRAELESRLPTRRKTTEAVIPDSILDQYNLRGYSRMIFEGPYTGIENGHIKSHQFYNFPEAARAWAAMVDSQNYRMYLDCLLSLKSLVNSKHWKAALESRDFDAAVTLGGGGSPEKDWVIATSLLQTLETPQSRLLYIMNDISPYMIQHTARFLHRRLIMDQLDSRIDIVYDWSDFLQLDMLFKRPDCRSVVWAILGGTIGNVSEITFFRSINGPSRIGDLLIVGIDTTDNESATELEQRMNAEYRSQELDALLRAPMFGLALPDDVNSPVVEVTVRAYEHFGASNFSDVPNSRTALFSLPSTSGSESGTVLAYSTRYLLDDFIAHAHQFGWQHIGTSKAPADSKFRQVLLRRIN